MDVGAPVLSPESLRLALGELPRLQLPLRFDSPFRGFLRVILVVGAGIEREEEQAGDGGIAVALILYPDVRLSGFGEGLAVTLAVRLVGTPELHGSDLLARVVALHLLDQAHLPTSRVRSYGSTGSQEPARPRIA